jgi:hypothetical protein
MTGHEVIVDHAHCLHQRVANGRAHELEASFFQMLAHGIGLDRESWDLPWVSPGIDDGLAANELPEVAVEAAELALKGK